MSCTISKAMTFDPKLNLIHVHAGSLAPRPSSYFSFSFPKVKVEEGLGTRLHAGI